MEPASTFMYSQHHIKAVDLATDSGSTSNMSISVMTSISEQDEHGVPVEDDCPDYDSVVDRRQEAFPWQLPISVLIFQSSSNGDYLNSHDDSRSSINFLPRALKGMSMISSERHMSSGSSRRNPRPLPRHERYIYTYRLLANAAPLHFMISCAKYPHDFSHIYSTSKLIRSVEPENGKPKPGKYTFRLSLKTNGIERSLGEPTTRTLRVDPRQLNFVVLYVNNNLGLSCD
jgi:hypothetical protein